MTDTVVVSSNNNVAVIQSNISLLEVLISGPAGPAGPRGDPAFLAIVAPVMDGLATIGVSVNAAREDHIHPSDTAKANKTANTFTGAQTPALFIDTAAAGASYSWNVSTAQVLQLTFGAGNITSFSINGGVAGTFYSLYLSQDSVGGRTIVWSGFKWPSGVVPTLSGAALATDILTFYYNGSAMYCTGYSLGVI